MPTFENDEYYDFTGEALKVDEPSGDFEVDPGSENSMDAGSPEMQIEDNDDPSPDEDGTGLHTSEELMAEDWDNDLQ
ncbi:hypothetical protein AR689_20650 [Arthrobacter sp. EpRS71]|nr:hypothetical protein AR689_20650 [Arthrobacter sp. EpRS71]